MFLKLFIIQLVVILIVDISGFIPNIKRIISKYLTKGQIESSQFSLKPFDCSLCLSFWSLLIFIIITGQLTFINVLYLTLLTMFTDVVVDIIMFIKVTIKYTIDRLYDKLRVN